MTNCADVAGKEPMSILDETKQELLMSKMTHNFTFSRDELRDLLALEFARGYNQCAADFKLGVTIEPEPKP